MADDIDIEEHDVLDHPQLRNIFPDLSRIKEEVVELDQEGKEGGNYITEVKKFSVLNCASF